MSARVEVEGDVLVGGDLLGETAGDHLGEGLLLGLRLPGQLGGAVTEARDVVLHVGDLVLLPLVALGLVLLQLGLGPHEGVVVTAVDVEAPLVQVDDVRANSVHEVLNRKRNFATLVCSSLL